MTKQSGTVGLGEGKRRPVREGYKVVTPSEAKSGSSDAVSCTLKR
uniref:Uncharacterized protein n=1 Tax=Lepeophtheirus salmonis TaxID=72036 RepID=A0A0K2TDE4_LEPSM